MANHSDPSVECRVYHLPKHPIGRDPGAAAASGYCGRDCEGYMQPPLPSSWWPGERDRPVEEREDTPHA